MNKEEWRAREQKIQSLMDSIPDSDIEILIAHPSPAETKNWESLYTYHVTADMEKPDGTTGEFRVANCSIFGAAEDAQEHAKKNGKYRLCAAYLNPDMWTFPP